MNGVGFDIGNHSCVVAEADHRGVHTVPNAESEYETPSIVSFSKEKREFGTHAKTLFASNPEATITDIKSMVGRKYNEIEKKWLLFPISEGPDCGILIHGPVNGNTGIACTYRPVQILAMLLAHLKKGAEQNMRGRWASECVIGIPAYFTDVERVAYLDATQIAGLKPKQLMHEGTAIALGYGYFRSEIKSETNVVFVDVGHCSTQITIVKFNEGGLKVLSHAWDRNIGSQDFDIILLDYFYKKLKLISEIDIYKAKPRSRARLISACEKTKKVLTTNTVAVLTIESFMNGIDVSIPIKREEFEKSIPSLLKKLEEVCHKAMKEANLNILDVKAVEVVGSGSRIPVVGETLTKYFGMELSHTLNSIECVARGCALQSTLLVESSALKSYKVEDSYPFNINYSSVNQSRPRKLFLKGQTFPITNEIEIAPEPIRLCLNPTLNDKGKAYEVRSFEISPSSGSTSGSPIVTLKISLDINGVLVVDLMQTRDGNKQSNSLKIEENWNILEISTIGMTKALLSNAKETEKKLLENDKLKEDTMRARNILESYIYNTREKVSTTYHNVITNSEKQRIERNLDELEEWLYDEGEVESKEKYEEKLKELEEMVDPIESHYEKMKVDSNASVEIRDSKHEYTKANGHTPKDIIEQEIVISDTHQRMALQTLVSVIQQELKTRHQYFATESEMKMISDLLEGIKEWLPIATSDEFKKRYPETCANLKMHWDPIMNRYDPEDDQAMKDLENTIKETRDGENLDSFQKANRKTISEECDKIEKWLLGDEKFGILRNHPTLNTSAIKEKKTVLEKMKQDMERKLSTASRSRISKWVTVSLKLLRTNQREVHEIQRPNCTNEKSITISGKETLRSAPLGTTSRTQNFVINQHINNTRDHKIKPGDSRWKKIKKVLMEPSRKIRS